MKIKTLSEGTRIRSEHNTGGTIINNVPANIIIEGTVDWVALSDVFNSSNIMVNKIGDRWMLVQKINGLSVNQGWIAITHKGQTICSVIEENVVEPPPVVVEDDPYVKAILITASGKEEVWLPQA